MPRPVILGDVIAYEEFIAQTVPHVITVPDGEEWRLIGAAFRYDPTATVGTRTSRMNLRNAADTIIFQLDLNGGIVASTVAYHALVVGTFNSAPRYAIPSAVLPEGFDVLIDDSAGVDGSDTITGVLSFIRQEI